MLLADELSGDAAAEGVVSITVATLSHGIRKVILEKLHRSGDPSLIDFKLHDFGYRGVSSEETAGIGARHT